MAAGSGVRFGQGELKQFFPVGARPMLAWSIARFAGCDAIDGITLVAAPGTEDRIGELVETSAFTKVDRIMTGGDTRQQSVWLGLQAIGSTGEKVLIHDAARPCLSAQLLDRILEALRENDAVVPVIPAVDTLVLEGNGVLDALLDRVHIAAVQTPQAFRRELIVRAHREAGAKGLMASDEGSLVFAMGEPVRTIPGERTNIKITFEDDVPIAEAILGRLE
jgi:2-C-methyl-D-erythritol 4-phosphate cytidylyltransferase